MTFEQAKNFVMPFGKHAGKTIDQVAESDDGLRYLDWLRGERGGSARWGIDVALEVYLSDPRTAGDLKRLLDDEGDGE